MKNKFQNWTKEDNDFAFEQRQKGKKFSTIANKLGSGSTVLFQQI